MHRADERVHEREDRGHDEQGEHELQRLARAGTAMTVTCSAGIRVTTQMRERVDDDADEEAHGRASLARSRASRRRAP